MKVSTKGRYGLNAMVELALNYECGTLTTKEIAQRQGIPDPYLEQLLGQLRKNDLVSSVRGVQGGYFLSRSPSEITIGQIMYAIEGTMSPADCIIEEENGEVMEPRCCNCAGKIVWKKIYESVKDVIDNMTLAQLLEQHERERNDHES